MIDLKREHSHKNPAISAVPFECIINCTISLHVCGTPSGTLLR